MHATSGATVGAAGVGLLRHLTEGRGRASIWITLEGLDFEASAALLFPSRATGARGFHIWWGGVPGGVRAAELERSLALTRSTTVFSGANSTLEFPTAAALPKTSGTQCFSLAWVSSNCSSKLVRSAASIPISLLKASISSCVGLFACWAFASVVGFSLVSSTTGSTFGLWESEGWVVGLEDLLSDVMGLFNDKGEESRGTFWKTTVVLWGPLGAHTVAAVGLIACVVVLVSSSDLGDEGRDWGLSATLPFPPESAGEHSPLADDKNGVATFEEAGGTQGAAV